MSREGRQLTAQCLYFVNLYPGAQEGSCHSQSMGDGAQRNGGELSQETQGKAGIVTLELLRINSWIKERSWVVSMWGVSDPENQQYEMGVSEINMDVYVLLM